MTLSLTEVAELLKTWLPIAISFLSLVFSLLALCWTIYKDAFRKPKFRVSLEINKIFRDGHPPSASFVSLYALNLGPAPNRCMSVYCRKSWLKRKLDKNYSSAFVTPDFAHQAASPVGMRVEVGDHATIVFPFDSMTFLHEDEFVQIGVVDGFGKFHWAPRKHLKLAQDRWRIAFQKIM